MRCDESPHGFQAGATTPGRRKAEVQTPGSPESGGTNSGSRESGVGVLVPEFTVFC
ncbi:hypothetical protein PAXRUDRAFT_829982, partial [Paxillus rubicundulus Ve08.2h10]